jgi:hypothetical protein
MIALAVAVVASLGALLVLVWLLTRNPDRDRQLAGARTDLWLARDLITRLHREALRSADVDPVAQVFADLISQSGTVPAQLRRHK